MSRHFRLLSSAALLLLGSASIAENAPSTPKTETKVGSTQCPMSYWKRTPEQVWKDHWASLQAGKLELAVCDYAPDAQVIMPNKVLTGREQILEGLTGFHTLFGGVPTFGTLTQSREFIFFTWTFSSPTVSVPDGADTYVVRGGHIYGQTVHATMSPAPHAAAK